jgi:hypothetical protein
MVGWFQAEQISGLIGLGQDAKHIDGGERRFLTQQRAGDWGRHASHLGFDVVAQIIEDFC